MPNELPPLPTGSDPPPPEPPTPGEAGNPAPPAPLAAERRWDPTTGRFVGSPAPAPSSWLKAWILASCVGLLVVVVGRMLFGGWSGSDIWVGVMSISFLFGVPLVVGFVTVGIVAAFRPVRGLAVWFGPWAVCASAFLIAFVVGWEGSICLVMWLPLFLPMSTVGGVAASALADRVRRRRGPRGLVLVSVVLLPYLGAPLEARFAAPRELRTAVTSIEVEADADTVWREIARVPAIRPEEHTFSWSHAIGFPRPVEARLLGTGVGAVRHATFEGGVLFVETVTEWEPSRSLAFTIRADSANIPPGTLDEHVTVGGPYFDVLDGRYEIVPLAPGRVRLVLASTHRLSTRFNAYAALWTDFVMRDVQDAILRVVKRRCER